MLLISNHFLYFLSYFILSLWSKFQIYEFKSLPARKWKLSTFKSRFLLLISLVKELTFFFFFLIKWHNMLCWQRCGIAGTNISLLGIWKKKKHFTAPPSTSTQSLTENSIWVPLSRLWVPTYPLVVERGHNPQTYWQDKELGSICSVGYLYNLINTEREG